MNGPEAATTGESGPLGLGAVARVFTAPTAAFRAVAADPQWVGPTLVCFLLALVAGWVSMSVVLEFSEEMTLAMMERMGAPEEAIDEAIDGLPAPDDRSPGVVGRHLLSQLISPIFSILLGAAVIHLGAKLMGGMGTFRASLAMMAVAMVIPMVGFLARSALMAMTGTVEVSLSPGAMMDYNSVGAILLELFDPFQIWYLVVLGIGASVVQRISRGSGFGIALVWFLLASVPLLGTRFMMAWSLGEL